MNQQTKTCQNCKQKFIIEPEDFDFYEKIKVPAPTFCPECRLQRRLNWRNERTLYKRECGLCGKSIISLYFQDSPFIIYCIDCWWSDKWDGLSYGIDYDFSKPFFVQWSALMKRVPLLSLIELSNVNSSYINLGRDNKDCYFSVSIFGCENGSYLYRADSSKECIDSSFLADCELCYEGVDINACHRVFFSRYAENCIDSAFLLNCRNVSNCFGCANLENVSHHIFNKQYSEADYQKYVNDLDLGSFKAFTDFKKKFIEFSQKFPRRYAHLKNTTNVIGDNLSNFKNCFHCFDGTKETTGENCKYILGSIGLSTNSYDVCYPIKPNFVYEVQSTEGSYMSFANRTNTSHHVQYTYECHGSSDLFACIGLRNKQYCIFNKQYTKQEYEKIIPKIIQHMNETPYVDKEKRVYRYGEFFPAELSPFAYNETPAQEYFPLTKEQVLKQSYTWKDPEKRDYEITIKSRDLPDNIKDVDDNILQQVIGCEYEGERNEQCTTAFKIIPDELKFYKKMNIPLPRLCPNCRHYQRLKQRSPIKLWHRKCQCAGDKSDNKVYQNTVEHFHKGKHCPNEFETTYASERPEIVYCEKCYQSEVV